ncbi:phage holin family protein [Branchiibius cervicis]|uniref:Phage holin family protein n=1 Tax=Branchiibius cervicis TaxID=908252 RepID=A0ABW2APH0_9MICO
MADQRSIGQMVSDVTTDLSSIVHNEIALAKLEIKGDITKGGRGRSSWLSRPEPRSTVWASCCRPSHPASTQQACRAG